MKSKFKKIYNYLKNNKYYDCELLEYFEGDYKIKIDDWIFDFILYNTDNYIIMMCAGVEIYKFSNEEFIKMKDILNNFLKRKKEKILEIFEI